MERTPELYAAFAMSSGELDREPAAESAATASAHRPAAVRKADSDRRYRQRNRQLRIPRLTRIPTSGVPSQERCLP